MNTYWTYFHNLDPFIIQFTQNFGIRWYSMAYIAGFILGYYLIYHYLIRTKSSCLSPTDWSDLVLSSAIGIILGGRLGYAVFYNPQLLLEWGGGFPYWGLLKIYEGGLASHGGMIGLVVAVILFARKKGYPTWHCLDLVSATAGLGIFFGRCANFINGELYGRVIQKKALIAVQFPQEMLQWAFEKNIEKLKTLKTAVSSLKTSSIDSYQWLDWIYQAEQTQHVGNRIYSVIHSLILACEKGNQAVITALGKVLSYRHPSQIYQALLEGLLPFLIVWFFWRKKAQKPGTIFVLFGVCYTLMRIVGEQFRTPDVQLGFRALGMTRGQWLSIITLILLVSFYIIRKTKDTKKWGGWAE